MPTFRGQKVESRRYVFDTPGGVYSGSFIFFDPNRGFAWTKKFRNQFLISELRFQLTSFFSVIHTEKTTLSLFASTRSGSRNHIPYYFFCWLSQYRFSKSNKSFIIIVTRQSLCNILIFCPIKFPQLLFCWQ